MGPDAMNLDKLHEMVRDRRPGLLQSMGPQKVGHDWATEQQHFFDHDLLFIYYITVIIY